MKSQLWSIEFNTLFSILCNFGLIYIQNVTGDVSLKFSVSTFLPPAYVVCRKVIFSVVSVCDSVHRGPHVIVHMGIPLPSPSPAARPVQTCSLQKPPPHCSPPRHVVLFHSFMTWKVDVLYWLKMFILSIILVSAAPNDITFDRWFRGKHLVKSAVTFFYFDYVLFFVLETP